MGTIMFRVSSKLDLIKTKVKGWSKINFEDIFVTKKNGSLSHLQAKLVKGNTLLDIQHKEEKCRGEWKQLLGWEEIFWKQRLRVQWLREGDKYSTFLHRSATNHKRRNIIDTLQNERGETCYDKLLLRGLATNSFKSSFTSIGTDMSKYHDQLLQIIPGVATDEANQHLLERVLDDEVRVVVLSMNAYKSPGPDGFPPAFYQEFWDIVGVDVSRVTRDFFKIGKMLRQHIKTFIVLIPKHCTLAKINDYRPISLCTTFYKILSKVLVNMIKNILDKLISTNQKGFFMGRKILDIAISTHEIINSMEKSRNVRMALKLDISKSYDNVN